MRIPKTHTLKKFLNCKKADGEFLQLFTVAIWIVIFFTFILPMINDKDSNTELIYTGTIKDYYISYGNGNNNDLTKVYFQDNTTLTFNQQMPYLQQNHTYTIKYYLETMKIIQIQSTEDFTP